MHTGFPIAYSAAQSPFPAPTPSQPREQAMRSAVTAILFRELLKPLAANLGPIGDIAIANVTDAFVLRPRR